MSHTQMMTEFFVLDELFTLNWHFKSLTTFEKLKWVLYAVSLLRKFCKAVFYFIIADPTTALTMWKYPSDRLLKEGDTVKIGCKGNGHPQPLFTFVHNEVIYFTLLTEICQSWKNIGMTCGFIYLVIPECASIRKWPAGF